MGFVLSAAVCLGCGFPSVFESLDARRNVSVRFSSLWGVCFGVSFVVSAPAEGCNDKYLQARLRE